MQIKEKYSVYSNLVYFGLFIYALIDGNNYVAMFLLFVLIGSLTFHMTKPDGFTWWGRFPKLNPVQKFFFLVDNIAVYTMMAYLLVNFYNIGFSKLPSSIVIIAFFGLIIFFVKHKRNYDFYHALWHILSAGVIFLFMYYF